MSFAQSPPPEELNNNPVPVNDVYTFHYSTQDEYYNTTFSIEPLLNDTDPDGDSLTIAGIAFYADSPSQDVTVLDNSTIISKGPSHFDYLVSDGKGGEAIAAVSIYGYLVPTLAPGTVEFNSHWHNVAGPGTPEPDDCLTWCFPVSGVAHESETGNVTGSWGEHMPRGALCFVGGSFQEMTTDGNTFELRGTSEGSCIWPEMDSPIIVEGECGVDSEISLTIGGQELRFIGDSACPPSDHLLKVDTVDLLGNPLKGVRTTIRTEDGALVKSGFTPFEFTGNSGVSYKVSVADYDGRIFQHWEAASTARARTITLTSDTTLTASFDIGDSIRGFTSLTYTGTEEQPDLTLNALSNDGSKNLHMWAIIDPQSSDESGTSYKVYASNYKDRVFDHWEDGSTSRIRTLTIDEGTTITAYYKTD